MMDTNRSLRRAGLALAAGAVILIGTATPALAAEFSNGSFEEPTNPGGLSVVSYCSDGSREGSAVGAWTVTSGCIDVSTNGAVESYDGNQNVDLSSQPGDPSGAISQTFDTVAGTAYIVTYAYGNNWGCTPDIDDTFTVSVDEQESPHTDTVTVPANTTETPEWQAGGYLFTATGTSATVTFSQTNSPADGCGALLDDVRVVLDPDMPLVDPRVAAGAATVALGGFVGYRIRRRSRANGLA